MPGWKTYRTRFLSRAKRIEQACCVTDACGRVQAGEPGDYLVQGSDQNVRIVPAHVFEDLYVEFDPAECPMAPAAHIQTHSGRPDAK